MESVILTNPAILIVSLIAVIFWVGARFIKNKYIGIVLNIISFFCVIGCTIYALLLGVELKEILAYILLFTLLGVTAFLPVTTETNKQTDNAEGSKKLEIDSIDSEKERVEGKNDEL